MQNTYHSEPSTEHAQQILAAGKRSVQAEIQALQAIEHQIGKEFLSAVEHICQARQLVVTGVGKSGFIARKIAAMFSSVGIPAVFLSPMDALHGDIGVLQNGDVVLLLSKSGTTKELLTLLPYIQERGNTVIGIIANVPSPLALQVSVTLHTPIAEEGCPLHAVPMASTTAALAMGDALCAAVMTYKQISIEKFSANHPLGQLGKLTSIPVHQVMHQGNELPIAFAEEELRVVLPKISEKGLGCVCVCTPSLELLGIITDGDIRRAVLKKGDISELRATDIMTPKPLAIQPETMCGTALALMEQRERQIGVLPVVNKDNICIGLVRIHDIIRVGIA